VQELLRNDALPYAEFYQRPGETLDYAFEWVGFLAQRWFPGIPFALNYAIRPRNPTGFQYVVTTAGLSAGAPTSPLSTEPIWPTTATTTLTDGSVTWTCAAIDNTSLASTISNSTWSADSGVTVGGQSLVATRTGVLVAAASNLADGDYYVRNPVTLASGVVKEGVLLIKVRATKL